VRGAPRPGTAAAYERVLAMRSAQSQWDHEDDGNEDEFGVCGAPVVGY